MGNGLRINVWDDPLLVDEESRCATTTNDENLYLALSISIRIIKLSKFDSGLESHSIRRTQECNL